MTDEKYSLEPLEDGTGGWLQHRIALDQPASGPGDDWVRPLKDDLQEAIQFSPAGRTLEYVPRNSASSPAHAIVTRASYCC